jgi:hypothetical protein
VARLPIVKDPAALKCLNADKHLLKSKRRAFALSAFIGGQFRPFSTSYQLRTTLRADSRRNRILDEVAR